MRRYQNDGTVKNRTMATINVRLLADDVVRDLKIRAADNNRSLEGEVRHILTEASRDEVSVKRARFLAISDALRRETAGTEQTPAELLIREDRDHGH